MAIPTTQKECTTRRIASLIIGLWDKVKDAFLSKTSRGTANGVASLDANGKVPSSQLPQAIYSDGTEFYTWKPDRRDNDPLCATSGICRSGMGMDPVAYSAGTWIRINVSNGYANGVVTLYMATYSDSNPVTYVVVVSAFKYGRHTIYVKGNQRSGYQRHINKFYLKTSDGSQAFVYFKLESACSFSFRTDGNITSQNVTVSDSAPYSDGIAVSSNDLASNVHMAFGELNYVYGTGGSQSVPVYVDQNGQVQPCTVGTSGIADDSVTASKVKDNETLPVNISGNAATAYWAVLAGVSPAKWYSLGTVGATTGSAAGYSFLIYGGQNIGENADNIWHLTVSNRLSSRKIIYTQLAGERATDIQFGCTVGENNAITVYMKRPAYSGVMRFVLLTSTYATPSITVVSGEPSGYIAGTERHVPLIEHVTTIPVNPTVGTIYAL